MHSHVITRSSTSLSVIRTIGAMIGIAWGWYITSSLRTQQFGFSFAIFSVAAIFVVPVVILAFIGLPWRTFVFGIFGVLLIVAGSVEAVATLEESVFRQKHNFLASNTAIVTQERLWPFSHHYMSYNPSSGIWSGGD